MEKAALPAFLKCSVRQSRELMHNTKKNEREEKEKKEDCQQQP